MITLYKPNETDFTHNGIGALDKNIVTTQPPFGVFFKFY